MNALFHLAVGLGIFLFGMSQLEAGAKDLSGRRLKNWILTSTRSPVSSALSGTVLTALLQSSSLVGLVVLAFASAGAIPLVNAVGVLLGANLGTTFTGWLVTLIGFKLDLEQAALPIVAIAGLAQIIIKPPSPWHAAGKLGLGFGLLLFGLSTMKDSVAGLPSALSFDTLQGYSPFIYLLIGTAMTAIIQSSSAMMILTLTALNAGLIALPEAAAIVIGADLGTTSTVLLGSLTGNTIKRQLALAHLLFNLLVDLAAFFIFLPLLPAVFAKLSITDPLVGLVAFHSFFNLAGLLVFLPFLKRFTRLISSIIKTPSHEVSPLKNIPIAVPETALPLLNQALLNLWANAILMNAKQFQLNVKDFEIDDKIRLTLENNINEDRSFSENYSAIKESEGEILNIVAKTQQLPLTQSQSEDLNQIVDTARSIVYSCKTLKDIHQNLVTIQNDQATEKQFIEQNRYHKKIYSQLLGLIFGTNTTAYILEESDEIYSANDQHHMAMDKAIYQLAGQNHHDPSLTSTQLNVNREIHHSIKSLLHGLKTWALLREQ